jgi:hypothetical protein
LITVRFPTGFSVQYNTATYVVWGSVGQRTTLLDRKDGTPLAFVPAECIVEFVQPCRTYNANLAPASLVQLLNETIDSPARRQQLSNYDLAELKRRLTEFNGKRKGWK